MPTAATRRASTARTPPATPEKDWATFLGRFTPAIQKLVRGARKSLRASLPAANELVYDNYNALAVGYSPTTRASDVIFSIAIYPKVVRLFFLQAVRAKLADPDGLLEGSGTTVRSMVLASPADLARPAVKKLMAEAVEKAKTPLPKTGCGQVIIKSVSAKQRPRRPA